MPETHDSMGETLIDALLERDCTSSNLQTALVLAVTESHVKLPEELSHQLLAIRDVENVPLSLAETDPEDLRVKVEALRIIFRQMIVFIIAYAMTQQRDTVLRKRIEKITARYGIRAPWEEDSRDSIN